LFLEDSQMEIIDGIRNFFQSLTVLGWFIFVVALVAFLVTSAVFLLRRDGDRYAWFMVILVAIFLGIGLRYGIPFATELLNYGIADSLLWVPQIQQSVGDAIDLGVAPWLDGDAPQPVLTVTGGDVTIISTSGPPTPVPDVPTSTPEAPTSATPDGVGGGDPTATLTMEEAATAVIIQQLTATYTPRPPTAEPTLDMSIWNVMTPAPTRSPGG